ncbi:MAG: leucine-rich repeat domain-containing protein [Chitinophagales bacterium]|nr:leucine-rich repeat domain-containing protein [Chitinophagales bacterium]
MKKSLFFIFTLVIGTITNQTFAQNINIPDANFKNALIAAGVDKNGDGIIQLNEAMEVTYLKIDSLNISSLEGIDNFRNLQTLFCRGNKITTLPLYTFTKLEELDCSRNEITSLDVSMINQLNSLECSSNRITNLYLGNSDQLKFIDCSYNNLTNLDISGLSNLEQITCKINKLTSINIGNQNKIKYLNINYNRLSNIQLSGLNQIEYLDISQNQLNNIDLSALTNLETLICYRNNLSSLDVSNLRKLKKLSVYVNKITQLNLSNLALLQELNCDENLLNSLDLNGVPLLENLSCSWNNLSNIDLSKSTHLKSLSCGSTQLKNIEVNHLTKLENLSVFGNQISQLDVSNLNNLAFLICSNTSISSLDLSNLKFLEHLDCSSTQIRSLDVSYSQKLRGLSCAGSPLEVLYMKNGINTKIEDYDGEIMVYVLYDVPNLKYICADSLEVIELKKSADEFGNNNVVINSFCSSTSGGSFNNLIGEVKFDTNNNGCDDLDIAFPNLKIQIKNDSDSGYVISGNDGNFSVHLDANTYRFTPILENPYYNIQPQSAIFTLPDSASPFFCVNSLGSFNDLSVNIIPVRAARPGFSDAIYKLVLKNQGTTAQSGMLTFNYDDNKMNVISALPSANLYNFGQLVFNFSNLAPFERQSVLVTMRTNAPTDNPPVSVGDILNFSAHIIAQADVTPEDNTAILYQTVIGSYDPNDKTCLEGDIITPDMVGKRVNYLIRFENAGTAPAENVVVTDYIDTTVFEVNSLLITDASHTCHTQISNGNKVQFVFSDIQLPFTEPDKHGFVAFSILLKDDLQIGDSIKNYANIFFDYNLPITTNEAISEVKNRVITSVKQKISDIQLSVYPNPSKGNFSIELKSNKTAPVQISVIDIKGKIVFAKQYTTQQNIIPIQLEKLSKGTYLLQAQQENDIISRKVVIQ